MTIDGFFDFDHQTFMDICKLLRMKDWIDNEPDGEDGSYSRTRVKFETDGTDWRVIFNNSVVHNDIDMVHLLNEAARYARAKVCHRDKSGEERFTVWGDNSFVEYDSDFLSKRYNLTTHEYYENIDYVKKCFLEEDIS